MTVYDVRKAVPQDTTMWIQREDGEYCETNEAGCLNHKWDSKAVKSMYPEYYKSIGCSGLTVVLEG